MLMRDRSSGVFFRSFGMRVAPLRDNPGRGSRFQAAGGVRCLSPPGSRMFPISYYSALATNLRQGDGPASRQASRGREPWRCKLFSAEPVHYRRSLVGRPARMGEATPAAREFAPAASGFYECRLCRKVRGRRCALFAMRGGVQAVLYPVPVLRASHACTTPAKAENFPAAA